MREIQKTDPVVLVDLTTGNPVLDNGKPVTVNLQTILRGRLTDPVVAGDRKGFDAIVFVATILGHVNAAPEDGPVRLENAEWDAVAKSVKEPSAAFNQSVAPSLLPLLRAIVDAPEVS